MTFAEIDAQVEMGYRLPGGQGQKRGRRRNDRQGMLFEGRA